MEKASLEFKRREIKGKRVSSLRKEGWVPVVCYGLGRNSESYQVKDSDLKKLLNTEVVVIDGKGDMEGKKVLIQDIEFDPIKTSPIHVDFLFVDDTHKVEHEVPVEMIGESPAVKKGEGVLTLVHDHISVEALPQDIPGHISVDISSLENVGDHITYGDIKLKDGLEIKSNLEDIIVSVTAYVEEKEEEPTEVDMESIEVSGKGGKSEETDTEESENEQDNQ